MFAETQRSRGDHRNEQRSSRSYERGNGDSRMSDYSQFSRSFVPDVSTLHAIASRGLPEAAFGMQFLLF